jgi:hypothetical protein
MASLISAGVGRPPPTPDLGHRLWRSARSTQSIPPCSTAFPMPPGDLAAHVLPEYKLPPGLSTGRWRVFGLISAPAQAEGSVTVSPSNARR